MSYIGELQPFYECATLKEAIMVSVAQPTIASGNALAHVAAHVFEVL